MQLYWKQQLASFWLAVLWGNKFQKQIVLFQLKGKQSRPDQFQMLVKQPKMNMQRQFVLHLCIYTVEEKLKLKISFYPVFQKMENNQESDRRYTMTKKNTTFQKSSRPVSHYEADKS